MLRIAYEALTFDDVLLRPAYSEILPAAVSIATYLTKNIPLNIPLVSAAMDSVTESRLAIALAQEGGIGFVHKNLSIGDQAREVRAVKKFETGVIKDPITISPNASVRELLNLTIEHNISGVPVVRGKELVGIVTHRDIRFEKRLDARVFEVMTPKEKLITATESASFEEITDLLHEHRIEKILLINGHDELRGMVTVKDIEKSQKFPNACKDQQGQLRVGASVGTSEDNDERVDALVEAGVDVIVVDSAHGHSKKVLDRISWIKQKYNHIDVIGGNVATTEGARALLDAGVNAVKVGIGPGSICTTRVVSGVGIPQITAIAQVADVVTKSEIPVIADGGIRYSGDIAKSIAVGASCVMVGSLLAGTDEAPGEVDLYHGQTYKSYRGMGSVGAMEENYGSADRYFQGDFVNNGKLVPEGIEGRVPYRGPVSPIIHQLMGGLRAAMGYTGCEDIEQMQTNAQLVAVSSASVSEGHVHDVEITKEAPNYPGKYSSSN